MIQIKNQIILYERVQEEYDEFIEHLMLNGVLSYEQLHELTLKTLILELVIDEVYTKEELRDLMKPKKPLEVLHRSLNEKI